MTRVIQDVTVDKISLVSKDQKPAVEKAETRFALFKTKKSFVQKATELYNRLTLSKTDREKLDKIISNKNVIDCTT